MMKSVLAVGLVAMLGSSALAADAKNIKELEIKIDSVNVKNNQFVQDLAALNKQTDEARKKALSLQKDFAAAESKWQDSAGGILTFGRGTGDPALKKAMDDARAKFDVAQKAAADLDVKAVALNREKSELLMASRKEQVDLKKQTEALSTAMAAQGVLTDFATIQTKLGDTDLVLERISNAYDKSLLGAYLKDKIGLLVNSQLMCEAVARCNVKERKEVPAERIQETLFPGTAGSTRKGNLYDKTHETKTAK